MSLTGNLRTMALPDILQWAATGRKTGTLHLQRGSIKKSVSFHDGNISSSWSNDPREYLGQFLVRDRRISEEQLFRALLKQEEKKGALGAILIGDGLIDEDHLRGCLKTKAEETIYDLFLWTEGKFEFKDGEQPEGVAIEMPVTAVVMEGVRRVDEWERIRKVFPTMNTTFKVLPSTPKPEDPVERQAVGLAASGKTLAEISLEMHRSEFETAWLLYDLKVRDSVQVDRIGEDTPLDTVGTIHDLLTLAQNSLRDKRFDVAMKAFEQVLALDRLNQPAKKGLIAVIEARKSERATKHIPLDKVPVLTMDFVELTKQKFDPQEGFVISRVNGQWDLRSILKLCPMGEQEALAIFARLLERKVVAFQ
jgi:hypothetical protein